MTNGFTAAGRAGGGHGHLRRRDTVGPVLKTSFAPASFDVTLTYDRNSARAL